MLNLLLAAAAGGAGLWWLHKHSGHPSPYNVNASHIADAMGADARVTGHSLPVEMVQTFTIAYENGTPAERVQTINYLRSIGYTQTAAFFAAHP